MAKEFGDFQTPPELVSIILKYLSNMGKTWKRVLEPTCGQGNFISGLLSGEMKLSEVHAVEIQADYVEKVHRLAEKYSLTHFVVTKASIFDLNFCTDLHWHEQGPLLIVGNPPWVTNSALGVLESLNLPVKTNLKGLSGIEALTGSSNFDIAEYIWLKLITELAPQKPTIALLCKTLVARNVLEFAYRNNLPVNNAKIVKINSKKWFGAAVDACLFYLEVDSGEPQYTADVSNDFNQSQSQVTIGIVNGCLVADVEAYKGFADIQGTSNITWRQGIKHDAAKVMELAQKAEELYNQLGNRVVVEAEYLYPLIKSSDVLHRTINNTRRFVVVPQSRLGEDTQKLKYKAPHLWNYLTANSNMFEKRKSSIYNRQPPFAIFGIGDYSFSPYKVVVSGLYKTPEFQAVGPKHGRPVMLDDTCYFTACSSAERAALISSLLNHPKCLNFIASLAFSDAKRPITKKLLQQIDIKALLNKVDPNSLIQKFASELERLGILQANFELLEKEVVEFLDDD